MTDELQGKGAGFPWDEESPEGPAPKARRTELELEFLRQALLRDFVQADRSQGVDESFLKKLAAFLKLVETLERLAPLASSGQAPAAGSGPGHGARGLGPDTPLAIAWKALSAVPELGALLERKDIRAQILAQLEEP